MADWKFIPVYSDFWHDKTTDFLLLQGGSGSGKSYFAAQWVLLHTITTPNQRSLVCRKYLSTMRRTVWMEMLDMIELLGLTGFFEVNKSEYSLTYTENKSVIWFGGIDNPEKIKGLKGVRKVWIEEATELQMDDFIEINRRLRVDAAQILMTYNPISTTNWIYRYFFERNEPNAKIKVTTYKDNPYLVERAVREYAKYESFSDYHHTVYALGQWGAVAGTVYKPFKAIDSIPDSPEQVIYGLDFGFVNSPTALLRVAIKGGNYYIEELIYETGLTALDLAQKIKDLGISQTDVIYADSAEPATIEQLCRGYYDLQIPRYNVKPARKEVMDGITRVMELHPNIYSLKSNTHLNKEVQSYIWQTDKANKPLNVPVKAFDHLLDALRYAVFTHHKKGGGLQIGGLASNRRGTSNF